MVQFVVGSGVRLEVILTIVSKLVYNYLFMGCIQPTYIGVKGHPFTKYQQDIPVLPRKLIFCP